MTELTPNEAYDLYVGMVTVKEFLAPFNNIDQAIDQLMVESGGQVKAVVTLITCQN